MARCKNSNIRASARKHHIVYKTTCQVTGRYYIGMHSTDVLDDGYLGSGKRLCSSVKKHGRDQHTRIILEELPSRQAASDLEKELITDELRKDPMCMNCAPGGMGAVDRPATKEETRAKLSIASKRFTRTKEHYEKVVTTRKANDSYKHTEETKGQWSAIRKGRTLSEDHKAAIAKGITGRTMSPETRAKIGARVRAAALARNA
jgi:hypothetical protein